MFSPARSPSPAAEFTPIEQNLSRLAFDWRQTHMLIDAAPEMPIPTLQGFVDGELPRLWAARAEMNQALQASVAARPDVMGTGAAIGDRMASAFDSVSRPLDAVYNAVAQENVPQHFLPQQDIGNLFLRSYGDTLNTLASIPENLSDFTTAVRETGGMVNLAPFNPPPLHRPAVRPTALQSLENQAPHAATDTHHATGDWMA